MSLVRNEPFSMTGVYSEMVVVLMMMMMMILKVLVMMIKEIRLYTLIS